MYIKPIEVTIARVPEHWEIGVWRGDWLLIEKLIWCFDLDDAQMVANDAAFRYGAKSITTITWGGVESSYPVNRSNKVLK